MDVFLRLLATAHRPLRAKRAHPPFPARGSKGASQNAIPTILCAVAHKFQVACHGGKACALALGIGLLATSNPCNRARIPFWFPDFFSPVVLFKCPCLFP